MSAKLSGKFGEGKMLAPKPTIGGNENHDSSLFGMNNFKSGQAVSFGRDSVNCLESRDILLG